MPASAEDLLTQLDLLLVDAPHDVTDPWRVVRGYLRRRSRRPSAVDLPAAEAIEETPTAKHFRVATEILTGVNKPDGEPVR